MRETHYTVSLPYGILTGLRATVLCNLVFGTTEKSSGLNISQCSRNSLVKLLVAQPGTDFHTLKEPESSSPYSQNPSLDIILSQINAILILAKYSFNVLFNIIPAHMSRFSKCFLPFTLYAYDKQLATLLYYSTQGLRRSQFQNILLVVQILK